LRFQTKNNAAQKMAFTGGDDIQIERENEDHNNGNNDGNDHNKISKTPLGRLQPLAAQQAVRERPTSTSGWNRIRSRNSSDQKARTPFWRRILSDDWRILPKQTGGWTLKPTTTLSTHSGIRLENGFLQWSTGTTMNMNNPCGQISKRFSNKNMQFKPTRG
jgi:hypothetical protein